MATTIKLVRAGQDYCFTLYSPIEGKYFRFHTITEAHNYCEQNGIAYKHDWE